VRETPTVGGGRVPVLLHLLGPNYRPQQITADLASFGQSRIVSSYQRPATSLRAADAAVCIMNDTP